MVMTRRHLFMLGGMAALLLAFWYVDIPSTIRLKTSILKLLPMKPATLNQSIRSVCAGSYAGMDVVSCYGNFRSEEAEAAAEADEKCERFKETLHSSRKDWIENGPKPGDENPRLSYLYNGSDQSIFDKYGILTFYPDDCSFLSINLGRFKLSDFH